MAVLRSKVTLVVLLATLAAFAVATYVKAGSAEDGSASVAGGTFQAVVEEAYAYDTTDLRLVVGTADNVFLGRVLARAGSDKATTTAPGRTYPVTLFSVQVQENVKGRLAGTVTVAQDGGYAKYPADGDYPRLGVEKGEQVRELVLFEGDPLLKLGRQYVFATIHDKKNDRHHIAVTRSGDIEIGEDHGRVAFMEKVGKAKDNQVDPSTLSRPLPNADRFSVEFDHGGHSHP